MSTIHNIEVTTIDGRTINLGEYKGKALLIVNVASECGLTPQYEQLEALYEDKKAEGLEILGFPTNEFGGQEPGSEAQIQEFCTTKYGVKFPMFSKICVNGDERHPLYRELLSTVPARTAAPDSEFAERMKGYGIERGDGDILWNFEKFLVNGDGEIVGHYSPDMTPDHPMLVAEIDRVLSA